MFVPPYNLIAKHLGIDPKVANDRDEVTVPRRFVDFLLQCVLEHAEFDETQYLRCNPDVAAAVTRKRFPSGREHFVKVGYFEGRTGGTPVEEKWYLARNPDVAAAKRAGKFEDGATQYRIAGANEWRQPNPGSASDIIAWKNLLEKK